jgi:hypothetical protein
MSHVTTIRSPGAIALGALFAGGTLYVLFSDITSPSQVTVDHVMTLLVLVGTLASGHMFWPHFKAWRVVPAAGLAVLFLAGTFYCVTTSAARNAEVQVAKAGDADHLNDQRAKLEADIREAKDDLRRQRESQTRECASGAGPRCAGRTKLAEAAASHVEVLEQRLAKMKPRQVANAGLKHAAKVFATLPLVTADEAKIERWLVLFSPFVKALFLEVATLVFLGIGIGHQRRPQRPAATEEVHLAELREKFFKPEQPTPPHGPRRTRKALPSNVVAFQRPALPRPESTHPVIQALQQAGRPLSNRELARAMHVSQGESSKRWQEVAHLLNVCRDGKHLRLSLRQQALSS